MRQPEAETEMAELRNEVAELKACVKELKENVGDLVAAWRAGSLVLSVVKWAAGLASAVAIVWGTMHGGTMK